MGPTTLISSNHILITRNDFVNLLPYRMSKHYYIFSCIWNASSLDMSRVMLGQVGLIDSTKKNYTTILNIIYHKYNFDLIKN